MDLEYFEERVCEELCDAKEYIKKAIEVRSMHPDWAKTLVSMSADELSHATNLYKMFEEYYAECVKSYGNNIPECLVKKAECIMEMYTEKGAKVKYLHEMYVK